PSLRVCTPASGERVESCEDLADPDETVLVVRGVELVRALVGDARRPPPDARVVVPPIPATPPGSSPFDLAVAGAVLVPTSGFGTGGAVVVALDWSPDPWLGLELGGLATFADPVVDDPAGSASASSRAVWLGADLRIPPTVLGGHRLLLGLAAACAGAELHARPAPGFTSMDGPLVALMLLARATF